MVVIVNIPIILKPIGYVKTNEPDEVVKNSIDGVQGRIEILPEYEDGLDGIEEFSHIIVIAYLNKVNKEQREVLKVKPFRKIARILGIEFDDVPTVGVFCTDSPHRPNPIALTIVELIKREENVLHVRGLDLYDGTPVLDIKAYTPFRSITKIRVPSWYWSAKEKALKYSKSFPE
ncbi:MAG: tRNA (N6-threonylcarbamoyladenosine(37)-N6)-methyltransferase TrmO [Thermoplasmata archaeon]|nr:tRNA (N6-threonylcarbamoyladenosine(37)-N6)-methyltransferase TrmO [Euryarchaeota archaeon]RLF65902.1 MAG: tRNA (N6-threonylcarbamoyladenosine(37)-N6)-methyltransferase TrmO [Thermoplasmata archaeon]